MVLTWLTGSRTVNHASAMDVQHPQGDLVNLNKGHQSVMVRPGLYSLVRQRLYQFDAVGIGV